MAGPHICSTCDISFSHKHHLQRHQRTIHGNEHHVCTECGASFPRKDKLKRHVESKHEPPKYHCDMCGKPFARKDKLQQHQQSCTTKQHTCQRCLETFTSEEDLIQHIGLCPVPTCGECGDIFQDQTTLKRHMQQHKKRKATSRNASNKRIKSDRFNCPRCHEVFGSRADQFHHSITHLSDPTPWQTTPPELDFDDDQLKDVVKQNASLIYGPHRIGDIKTTFNFPMTQKIGHQHWSQEIRYYLEAIASLNQPEAFKINFALGFVLLHRDTGEYRYFVPHTNNFYFKKPIRIDRPSSWNTLYDELTEDGLLAYVIHHRDSTKWIPLMVTNLVVSLYHLGISMGSGELPDFVKKTVSIIALDRKKCGGKPLYDDNNCACRALAYHLNLKDYGDGYKDLELRTNQLVEKWGEHGLKLDEVPSFEERFEIGVDIFTLCEDGSVIPRYLTSTHFEKITLNLYDTHLSYVQDVRCYLKKYQCACCERHFVKLIDWKRHQGSCAKATRFEFPGGYHHVNPTIFQRLEEVGISVPKDRQNFPWFAVFDFEAMLIPVDEGELDKKLNWTTRHEAVSVSISSNVPGFKTWENIIDPDPEQLIHKMMTYIGYISDAAYFMAQERWSEIPQQLQALMDRYRQNSDDTATGKAYQEELNRVASLFNSFDRYCRQLPVLSFNGSNYDINLVKNQLLPWLQKDFLQMEDERLDSDNEKRDSLSVIKKGSSYTQIGSRRFKFLDVINYLAGGVSLDKFLKAYQVPESKSFFPYEWFDSPDKLDFPNLPPYKAFYSKLKGYNTLEKDGSGFQRYEELKQIWKDNDMTTFRDFLRYYNNLDVGPMVAAVEKMQAFYFSKDIDLFKIAVSVPGIARRWLFQTAKTAGASFALIHKNDDDLYYTMKRNIVGGPSIIFTRDAEVDRTFIKNNPQKPCKNIVGFDANALYLWAIGENMPCGGYVRRHAPEFKADPRLQQESMYHWMDYLIQTEKRHILHSRNNSSEIHIGPYRVDGYEPQQNVAYEFYGCYFHGCDLCGFDDDLGKERRKRTQEREEFLRQHVTNVTVIWEHEFNAKLKPNSPSYDQDLHQFVQKRIPSFYSRHKYDKISEKQLISAVTDQSLFGFLEVDIHVPQHLHSVFEEMSPIFCNTDVTFEDMGFLMQHYVMKKNMSTHPRRLLVGGMRATKILLSTPLLRWYLEKGLQVTRIYQVIEYTPQACFKEFVNQVSEARRAGDVNPNQAIIADTMKLIGNSGYGSLIMDKEKHQDTKYIQGKGDAQIKINDPLFRKCTVIHEDLFEIESAKQKIVLDLPIQLGYHILQLAKLRMLEFKYDFMDRYCQPNTFEYLEMDTDSAYMALAGSALEAILHPHMKEDLRHQKFDHCHDLPFDARHGFFPRECCGKHKAYDKRTPGLFKVEAEGNAMIALCSKTYILKQANSKAKYSCKGINKTALNQPMDIYRHVLESQDPYAATNRGFAARDNTVFTYEQVRDGISYFYCKRKVLDDGIHTQPLDITLSPWPVKCIEVVDQHHPWSLTKYLNIDVNGQKYPTLQHVCRDAMTKDDPRQFVKGILDQLPDHTPQGEIRVAVTKDMLKQDFKFWNTDSFWTTGMTPRATPLKDNTPGQNVLGQLLMTV